MTGKKQEHPIVLGISGASGTVYGMQLLKFFLENDFKVDLVFSNSAFQVAKYELNMPIDNSSPEAIKNSLLREICSQESKKTLAELETLLTVWGEKNIAASISSGSYKTQGMIVAPCSMGTLANIAAGTSSNLLTRAADVTIKEGRKLILIPRETPLSQIHLKNMLSLSQMGVHIVPPSPGFYHNPQSIDDLVNFILGKVLDVFGIDNELFKRWSQKTKTQEWEKSQLN